MKKHGDGQSTDTTERHLKDNTQCGDSFYVDELFDKTEDVGYL